MLSQGFDRIASVYDGLAQLVFGQSIVNAQLYFIDDIPPNTQVLILGGGTGWFLSKLLEVNPTCEIWYIEISEKMMEASKERVGHSARVHFIRGTQNDIPNMQFDAVVTNFYLDLFSNTTLPTVVGKIKTTLKPGSLWLATDFVENKKWWQTTLLKIMYSFFKSLCKIEADRLPDWHNCLVDHKFTKTKSQLFYSQFIEATIYKN